VELGVPDPAKNWFIVESSLLDGPKLLAPDPLPSSAPVTGGAFTTDKSLLDSTTDLIEGGGGGAGDLPSGFVWTNYTSTTMDVQIDRGIDVRQGIVARPVAGVLRARIHDPYLDALSNQNVGLDTIIRVRVGDRPVFTGEVTSLLTSYDAESVPVVEVEAADAVARLNSTHMTERPAEDFHDRVQAVLQDGNITGTVEPGGHSQAKTDKPRTALETLHLAVDTEGALCWVDVRGHLHAYTRDHDQPGTAKYLFSDNHTLPGHTCLTAIQTGIDTTQVINQLRVTNIEFNTADPDPTRHRFENKTHEFDSHVSARYYGVAPGSVTTALPPGDVSAYASWAFGRFDSPKRKTTRLEYVTDELNDRLVPEVAFIDVADTVRVRMDNAATATVPTIDDTHRVAWISHRITPNRWTTQLDLL
jgi:hypothetical protein